MNWRKSSFSGNQNACVELAVTPGTTHVRDSKNPAAGTLAFGRRAAEALLASLRK